MSGSTAVEEMRRYDAAIACRCGDLRLVRVFAGISGGRCGQVANGLWLVMKLPGINDVKIAIISLGYVSLPLALCMAPQFPVFGYDIDVERVSELQAGRDRTREVSEQEFAVAGAVLFSADPEPLQQSNFFIVAVPATIDRSLRPDFGMLERASETVGKALKKGDVVVYESTVYPGGTEEICVPILESVSGLVFNEDFAVGYSPERINPGDRVQRFPTIAKVTSGSTPEAADLIDQLYARVVSPGTHKTSSIRVAEASKVIENIKRDVNIALVNELAQLFRSMGLETREILAAVSTKWNFHGYVPGFVGGQCIGVDPYYLSHKAQSIGFDRKEVVRKTYGIALTSAVPQGSFEAIVLAGRHDEITRIGAERLRGMLVSGGVLYDLKQVLPIEASDARL
jgi:UDP-N-acetyl-D-galactosamine dehydrogenase